MKFSKDNLVRYKWDDYVGQITDVKDTDRGAEYLVKWTRSGREDWVREDEIRLVDEKADKELAARVQGKIDQATTLLEEAWKAWNEAKDIADADHSFHSMQRADLINFGSFGAVAENFGWSSSSLYC